MCNTADQRYTMEQSPSLVGQFVHDECQNRGAKIDVASSVNGLYRLAIDVKRGRDISPGRLRNLYALHGMIRHAARCRNFKGRVDPDSGVGAVTWGRVPGELPHPVRLWTPNCGEDWELIDRDGLREWFMGPER
jgi:hypothetical protein